MAVSGNAVSGNAVSGNASSGNEVFLVALVSKASGSASSSPTASLPRAFSSPAPSSPAFAAKASSFKACSFGAAVLAPGASRMLSLGMNSCVVLGASGLVSPSKRASSVSLRLDRNQIGFGFCRSGTALNWLLNIGSSDSPIPFSNSI